MKKNKPTPALQETLFEWLVEWEDHIQKRSFGEGLVSILPKLETFRRSYALNLFRPMRETQKLMQRTLRCFTVFVAYAPLELVKEKYLDICRIKPTLGPIIDAAGLSKASGPQLWKTFANPAEGATLNIYRALALVTLTNIHQFPGKKLTELAPSLAVPLALACLTQRSVLSETQHANQHWLLTLKDFYERYELPNIHETYAVTAWMYCSYAHIPEKHALKRSLNRMFLNWMERQKWVPTPTPLPRLKKPKPTIVIFAEFFSDEHAMFRCHGKSAMALQKHFFTVLMGDLNEVSAKSRMMFSKTIHIDKSNRNTGKALKLLKKVKPDMIYYPSVGMSGMAIALSNLRIAPIQFLSMGHPASTFSDAMDYVIVNNDLRPDPACFSEKVIHRRQSAGYTPSPHWDRGILAQKKPVDKSFKNIGIIGFMPKNTREFLLLCKRLEAEVDQPIKFHFMPHSVSSEFFGFMASLFQELKSAAVYPRTNYVEYMQLIDAMDLVLSTFPFGNTNGTIDTLLAGVPMLALEGPEPHAKTDARLLRKVGAPPEMLASSEEDYFQTAKAWLSDPDLLAAKRAEMAKLDVEGTFYNSDEASDFDEVVRLIYETHEKLQADPRREFEYEDLVTLQQKGAAEQQA